MYNGYYIRNNYDKITTYEISDDCIFQLTPYDSDPYSSEPLRMVDVNYDILFSQIEKAKKNQDAPLLFWFELKNNSAYLIHKQFLP